MNIPKLAINNFQFTLIAFIFLLVMGIVSFLSMPRSEDPVMSVPEVGVVAVYPGANPKDMESQVVDIIEEGINELDDLKEIQTRIRDGVAFSEVEFEYGVDTDEVYDEVQSKLNSLSDELPQDLYDLEVIKFSTSTVNIFQIALTSETASYGAMQEQAERLENDLEKIDGIRKIEIVAYPEQEVRVALNPVKMTEMNISLEDVEQAIQSSNANIPGGALKVSNKLFNIKTSGSYETLEEIANTVVGSYEGKLIYLKNVASVYFDYEDERWMARLNQERCLYITIQQKKGQNIYSVAEPVKETLANFELPENMDLHYVFDQSEGVSTRVNGFLANLLQGILLVGVIIFLALGVRSASLVMLAVPFSILIGLWLVDSMGFALQQMSIAGLVVALGLLVDNSIAIIENIERFLGSGFSRKEAAVKATQQLLAPVASATLTTILAFIPIILMPDTVGEFIRALPVTVIATLAASLLIAVTLTPFLASRWLKETDGLVKSETRVFRQFQKFVNGPYERALKWTMRHKYLTIGLAIGALTGTLALFPLVGVSFFPKAEKPLFRITVNLPNGSNLDATDEAVQYVEQVLEQTPEVKYYAANIGHGNPRLYYNTPEKNYDNAYGEIFVQLKEYDVDEFYRLLDELRAEFSTYSNARIDVREFVQGPPSEAPIAIKIFGSDLDKLQNYAQQTENIVQSTLGAINVDNPIATNSTDLYFHINRDKAMMFGVPLFTIDKTIRTFLTGTSVGKFRDLEGEDYEIVLRYDANQRFQLEDFEKISVQSLTGRFIPLRQLANIEFAEAPSQITHLDLERTATILADLDKGVQLDDAVNAIRAELDQLDWEDGYTYTFKGDLESRNESFGGMGVASAMALLLIFGVLVIQFKSFLQPLIIFSALPLAIIGSILALFITGISFSFTAFIGLTSLIGIAINNSIVLVDFANVGLKEDGLSVQEAAIQAGKVRFIPIVLTTLTTILGLLPLTLAGGSMWAPMGWTIIGGLLTSTTFVLLLVPILYQLFTQKVQEEV